MLTAERRTTPKQREYIQEHLAKLKEMMAEIVTKKSFLQDRLKKFPEKSDFIQREIEWVEAHMSAMMVSVDFIEKWPESCVGLCPENLPPCTHQNDCPHWQAEDCLR